MDMRTITLDEWQEQRRRKSMHAGTPRMNESMRAHKMEQAMRAYEMEKALYANQMDDQYRRIVRDIDDVLEEERPLNPRASPFVPARQRHYTYSGKKRSRSKRGRKRSTRRRW